MQQPGTLKALLIVLFSLIVALLVTPDLPFLNMIPDLGEVASQDLKSPGDFVIEDVNRTNEARDSAEDAVLTVYDLDKGLAVEMEGRLEAAFESARRELEVPDAGAEDGESESTPSETQKSAAFERFVESLGTEIPSNAAAAVAAEGFSSSDEELVRALVRKAMAAQIVSNQELLRDHSRKGIVIRDVRSRVETKVKDPSAIEGLDAVRSDLRKSAGAVSAEATPDRIRNLAPIAEGLIRPNLTFNRSETEERKSAARESVKPVTILLKKGEIIVRDGDPIQPRHIMLLEAIRKQSLSKSVWMAFVGIALFLLLTTASLYSFAQGGVRKFRSDVRSTVFFFVMIILMVLLTRIMLFISEAVASAFPLIPPEAYRYAIPVASGAMLIRMLRNSETAIFFAAILSLILGLMVEQSFFFTAFAFLGSIVGAYGVAQVKSRSEILKAGARVGLMNAALVALWALMEGQLVARDTLVGILAGFSGGLAAAIVVTGVTPIAEWALGEVTGLKLLELSNNDQPLLRELALRAPGTFHHSMIIANLVESGAESIQANPLLARVSAYYHDVGKTLKPQYYVENMLPGENKHDKLSPAMSCRILKAHVKDGIELAKRYDLPQVIIDAIPQHHGTSLIKFFYEKALDASDAASSDVSEMEFRYPGPKPHSRECAILMLADSVEAAARTLSEPNRVRIQGAVQKIINNIYRDGQLDECDLTLRDLHDIARSFTDTLVAVYHGRVAYPEPVAKGEVARKKKADESQTEQPAEPGEDRPKRGAEAGKEDLKRLGMS